MVLRLACMHAYWQTDPNSTDWAKDYTPQNKPAQGVITHWYSQDKPVVPEFPSALFLPLFIMVTLLAVVADKRKVHLQ